MATAIKRIEYTDFEHIMIRLSLGRGWSFKFGDDFVPIEAVFNHSTYAPALLSAAGTELAMRQIPGDLGFKLEGEANSLFGARVTLEPNTNSAISQFWRLATTVMIIESLPRSGNHILLDPLQYVLGDRYADFVQAPAATEVA